jgi:hypothetical protein
MEAGKIGCIWCWALMGSWGHIRGLGNSLLLSSAPGDRHFARSRPERLGMRERGLPQKREPGC